ncbi:MAG: hypothetical protein Greene07147_913 [Parcubacteria group bacterium Greene0714_7]|nr:MAG: hypothetical protein Greene07147_913 [Parcubacteria group bacterium Greene0714_7]
MCRRRAVWYFDNEPKIYENGARRSFCGFSKIALLIQIYASSSDLDLIIAKEKIYYLSFCFVQKFFRV